MNTAQNLPDLSKISCSGSFLSDFVENFPNSCHVKDIHTRKYLITNHHMVINCGMKTVDDIIEFTPHEVFLDEVMLNKKKVSQNIISIRKKHINLDDIENKVLSTKQPISARRFIVRENGTVKFENFMKFCVQNHDHKIIALLSIFLDLTNQVPLLKLFRLYQEFYPRKEATQKFLNHFNIEGYFESLTPLTYTEIQILISMRDDYRSKAVARKFGCSIATVRNHISNIQSKIKSCSLHDVLSKLPVMPTDEQSMYVF